MGSESKKKSSSAGAILFTVGAVVFAAVTGLLVARLMGQKYSREPLRPVVVAAADIAAGQPLSSADLKVAQWPASSIPRGAFARKERLLRSGAVPLVTLAQGSPVLYAHVSKPDSGFGVAAKLREGQRALAIAVDSSVTLARLIYPGAHVDVVTTFRERAGGAEQARSKVILQNLKVLAVGSEMDPVRARRGAAAKKKGIGGIGGGSRADQSARRVVTLALTPQQAERLTLARREGRIDLILRSPRDEERVSTPGATPQQIWGSEELGQGRAGGRPGRPLDPLGAR